ncbi:unnamed protein product [Clonostachys solani]|uniref:Uncharacterized protein n=1 Tax=Clonostachys solani TaxID=160281 RepID=A0A9P0EFU5_9HYPO|nr:unnamed protein product [Clonostachys solani]
MSQQSGYRPTTSSPLVSPPYHETENANHRNIQHRPAALAFKSPSRPPNFNCAIASGLVSKASIF